MLKKHRAFQTTLMTQTQLIPDVITKFWAVLKEQGLNEVTFSAFRSIIKNHYKTRGRKYPFRDSSHYNDPYKVIVSEIMLQQTQADRVVEKYLAFIKQFPDFKSLANASTENVLKAWIGLGYNRRALALKEIAETVITRYQGKLPASIEKLEEFPSIGSNTAASIATFAFNMAVPFIETNVRAVYLLFFFHGKENVKDTEILDIVKKTLDRENPREWYYALMDYGVLLKKTGRDPTKKSTDRPKQKPFKGSTRQFRGNILKALIQGPKMIDDLASELCIDKNVVENVAARLVAEGFLVKEGSKYKIK